ncbi:MAG: hypothetical protein LBP80_02660 [Treponema sp.]|nr:hypothetical protein [Treponema sp.]
MVFFAGSPAFSQNTPATNSLDGIQAGIAGFTNAMAESLPLNSTLGLNWSDAYIGKLMGVPPHFGVGLSAGFTTIKTEAFHELLDRFGVSVPAGMDAFVPIPAYTGELRLGGFGIPFDLGFKAGYLPPVDLGKGTEFSYFLIGGDFRFAILEDKAIIPGISVGLGAYHLSGGISAPLPGQTFGFLKDGDDYQIKSPNSRGDFTWETTTLELKAQISKRIFIITPYLGAGLNYAWVKGGAAVKGDLEYNTVKYDDINQALSNAGISGFDFEEDGFSSVMETSGIGFRAFGGFAFNILAVKIDLTGMVDSHGNFGTSLGVRFQL